MTKNSKTQVIVNVKKNSKAKAKKNKPKKKSKQSASPFGPVSAIDTAPVAIGNSVRGSAAQVLQSKDGVLVRSRDFMFPAVGTGTIQTWTMCGGSPITPAVFSDSTLRNYMQMYQKYRWRKLVVHYITSSATTATGDVMFYHQKNRNSVFLNQTSTQLLPFVLNDDDTVIGPQWTNHSTALHVTGTWKSTDYGMSSQVDMYADGDLFLLSKTSTTDSPGYILFDYEVQFAELQISPRLLSLPLPRAQWSQLQLQTNALVSLANVTQASMTNGGNNISGTASTTPAGITNGDVYKVIFDITNSNTAAWTVGLNTGNIFVVNEAGGFAPLTIQDGTTLYATFNSTSFNFYANAESAFVNSSSGNVRMGLAGNLTSNIQSWISLIGTVGSTNINPNY